ncbi:unnamed protein product [Sphagnum troendelagicum]
MLKYFFSTTSWICVMFTNNDQNVFSIVSSFYGSGKVYNVRAFGANGNGVSSDSPAFLSAWTAACHSTGTATILVPAGFTYLLASPTDFSGAGCSATLILEVDGLVVAPKSPSAWKSSGASAHWIQFTDCTRFTLQGKGIFDGSGAAFWAKGGSSRPMAIRFLRATNVQVLGITIRNSPMVHLKFNNCNGGLIKGVTISAPANTPNTDGIHFQTAVSNFEVADCKIGTGDDCVSVGTGTSSVSIHDTICGPGHGIRIPTSNESLRVGFRLAASGAWERGTPLLVSRTFQSSTLCSSARLTAVGSRPLRNAHLVQQRDYGRRRKPHLYRPILRWWFWQKQCGPIELHFLHQYQRNDHLAGSSLSQLQYHSRMLTSRHEQHQPGAHKQPAAWVLLLRVLWNSFRIDAARQLPQTHGRHFNSEQRRQRNLWLLGSPSLQQFFFLVFVFAAGRPRG